MPRTPVAWPTCHVACLKELASITGFFLLTAIRILAIVIVSVYFVLRLRHIWIIRFRPRDSVKRSPRIDKDSSCSSIESDPAGPGEDSAQSTKKKTTGINHSLGFHIVMAILFLIPCVILVLFHFRLVMAIHDHFRSLELPLLQTKSSPGLKETFQLYQPIQFAPETSNGGCDVEMILMEHVFGSSYGKPFVGILQWFI